MCVFVWERISRVGVIVGGRVSSRVLNVCYVAAPLQSGWALAVDPTSISRPGDSGAWQWRGFWIKQNGGVLWNKRLYTGPVTCSDSDTESQPHRQRYTFGSRLCGNNICSGGEIVKKKCSKNTMMKHSRAVKSFLRGRESGVTTEWTLIET